MTSIFRPLAWKVPLLVSVIIIICCFLTYITPTSLDDIMPRIHKEQKDVKTVTPARIVESGPHMVKGKHPDIVLRPLRDRNIHARESYGCHQKSNLTKLTFKCQPAIEMDFTMSLTERRERFYQHMRRVHADCKESVMIGNAKDGGWRACEAGPYAWKAGDCLIYSVGINRDWSFDETSEKKYGCHVHSFDPTIGLQDHQHSDRITFHSTGLGARNEVNEKGWKMRTLCTLLEELGHGNSIIDYVKFDIEFSEWPAIMSMLQEGCLSQVKQIGFEIHAWEDTIDYYMVYWQVLQGLENEGFQRWYLNNRNWNCFNPVDNPTERYCPQADMGYINTKFLEERQTR